MINKAKEHCRYLDVYVYCSTIYYKNYSKEKPSYIRSKRGIVKICKTINSRINICQKTFRLFIKYILSLIKLALILKFIKASLTI